MKALYLTVGFPYSGKSTWSRKQNVPIVNPDSIRLSLHGRRYAQEAEDLVWAIAMGMVRSLFFDGHERVIVDACHNTRKRRDFWVSKKWDIYYKVFDTKVEVCKARALSNDDDDIIPVIDRMAVQHENLWKPSETVRELLGEDIAK